MYRADFHTHTPLCRHADGTPEAFVERAVALGLKEYGIADHAPMPGEPFDDWRMLASELPAYFEWIERAKKAAEGTDLTIRCGLECDWLPGIEPWIDHLRSLFDWDYLIGSVHYLAPDWPFDDPAFQGRWHTGTMLGDWKLYWKHYAAMAASGLFDIYGHCDLIRKWGTFPEGDWTPLAHAALDAMRRGGGIMEVNTAGFHTAGAEQYPVSGLLKLAHERGIPVVINSDAHTPSALGRDYERAVAAALAAGYACVTLPSRDGRRQFPLV